MISHHAADEKLLVDYGLLAVTGIIDLSYLVRLMIRIAIRQLHRELMVRPMLACVSVSTAYRPETEMRGRASAASSGFRVLSAFTWQC